MSKIAKGCLMPQKWPKKYQKLWKARAFHIFDICLEMTYVISRLGHFKTLQTLWPLTLHGRWPNGKTSEWPDTCLSSRVLICKQFVFEFWIIFWISVPVFENLLQFSAVSWKSTLCKEFWQIDFWAYILDIYISSSYIHIYPYISIYIQSLSSGRWYSPKCVIQQIKLTYLSK